MFVQKKSLLFALKLRVDLSLVGNMNFIFGNRMNRLYGAKKVVRLPLKLEVRPEIGHRALLLD